MPPALLIATMNQGKLREFRTLVPDRIRLVTLADLGLDAPEETGATFVENADLKALAAAQASGLLTLADDSGLEVDALGGAPGVFSARYAGEPPSDERNIEKLLDELRARPGVPRTARFRCAISVAFAADVVLRGEGRCEGGIADAPRGWHGFGYDPVFVLPAGLTMAELISEEKNRISHRSMAIDAIAPALRSLLEHIKD